MPGVERPPRHHGVSAPGDVLAALDVLERGEIEVLGLIPYASNYTFLARVRSDDREVLAVYKPRRGETPLWDFPSGTLAAREVAAFVVSEAAGWGVVPPTVLRTTGPLGKGSLQLFIEHDPDRHYFVLEQEPRYRAQLQRIAAFDVVVNNADRKAGHVIEDATGKLWAVDHGVTFHAEPKLRTVVWSFAERALPDEVARDLERVKAALDGSHLAVALASLLALEEVEAVGLRVEALLRSRIFPVPGPGRPLPWPLV